MSLSVSSTLRTIPCLALYIGCKRVPACLILHMEDLYEAGQLHPFLPNRSCPGSGFGRFGFAV